MTAEYKHRWDTGIGEAVASLPGPEIMHLSRLVTIGELSACFAHEVFNPLMLIQCHLRMIAEQISPDSPLRANVEAIQRASKRIEEMADRMLDFSRKRTPQTEPCDCGELVNEALRFMQPYLKGELVEIRRHIDPDLPQLLMDRWEIIQAFVNLFRNAIEAMARTERKVLQATVTQETGAVRISISDTGAGIAPADLSRVFNPFFTTKGEMGTGLGLYIARRVIEEHNGTIAVQTTESGTTFTIAFPRM
jgi:two-component system NtrC family sensor kinase